MSLKIERGKDNQGIQVLRARMDIIDNCNLGCHYCSANQGWSSDLLTTDQIGETFSVFEDNGLLEVVLTGGEVMVHPEFSRMLEETHILDRTLGTFVTNATRVTPEVVREVRDANIGRISVSVDGPDAESHNSRRGDNFDTVIQGLRDLQQTGKRINVVTVAHADNHEKVLELSELLVRDGLASEHFVCAVYNSGAAKRFYDKMSLSEGQLREMQARIDDTHNDFLRRGLNVHFSNYWAATGERGTSDATRSMFLAQFCEQVKNLFMVIRPNGDVRVSLAAWGNETVGNQVVGNMNDTEVEALYQRVDEIYRSGRVLQLPRVLEAGLKFHVGPHAATSEHTIRVVTKEDHLEDDGIVQLDEVRPLSEHDLLQNPLDDSHIEAMARQIRAEPGRWRILRHPSGVDVIYDRHTQHMTILKPEETQVLAAFYDRDVA